MTAPSSTVVPPTPLHPLSSAGGPHLPHYLSRQARLTVQAVSRPRPRSPSTRCFAVSAAGGASPAGAGENSVLQALSPCNCIMPRITFDCLRCKSWCVNLENAFEAVCLKTRLFTVDLGKPTPSVTADADRLAVMETLGYGAAFTAAIVRSVIRYLRLYSLTILELSVYGTSASVLVAVRSLLRRFGVHSRWYEDRSREIRELYFEYRIVDILHKKWKTCQEKVGVRGRTERRVWGCVCRFESAGMEFGGVCHRIEKYSGIAGGEGCHVRRDCDRGGDCLSFKRGVPEHTKLALALGCLRGLASEWASLKKDSLIDFATFEQAFKERCGGVEKQRELFMTLVYGIHPGGRRADYFLILMSQANFLDNKIPIVNLIGMLAKHFDAEI
ncbi:unnamed protein product [Acanthoscelides obtectus]|uniref:Uncharacterized protein n=1 Tax=Acanthoscelides obtectus TaxID=200917 RepID=A0A9P0PCI2_ACAOB|nr:unnamed protein product [Acanthoscelides obtectus]CAK1631398.1 hypothetical protein AOBTE_LOCUS6931 [Acanthoscelides obtectus]